VKAGRHGLQKRRRRALAAQQRAIGVVHVIDEREQVGLREAAQDFREHALRAGKVEQPVVHYGDARRNRGSHRDP